MRNLSFGIRTHYLGSEVHGPIIRDSESIILDPWPIILRIPNPSFEIQNLSFRIPKIHHSESTTQDLEPLLVFSNAPTGIRSLLVLLCPPRAWWRYNNQEIVFWADVFVALTTDVAKTFNFKFGADKYGTNLSTYLHCRSTKTALFGIIWIGGVFLSSKLVCNISIENLDNRERDQMKQYFVFV